MSREHPMILFNGSEERLSSLQAEADLRQWAIIPSTDAMETLAHYIAYMPDFILVEDAAGQDMVSEILYHMESIGMQDMIVLTDQPQTLTAASLQILPQSASDYEVIHAIQSRTQSGAALAF